MSSDTHNDMHANETAPTYGVLAEFDDVNGVIAAARKVRDAGYRKWDCHTPFPIHGLDDAMGIRPTRLPWLTLGMGLAGVACALLLQWWTNAYDYKLNISGKPFFSLPANIPVTFELGVLFAAFTTFFAVLGLNRLPMLFHPLLTVSRFGRATNDKFFISIEAKDPKFNASATIALLQAAGAGHIETVMGPKPSATKFPGWLVIAASSVFAFGLIPLSLAAKARFSTSSKPRIHIVPDMDNQPKSRAQTANALFADGRASRLPVEGTIAMGDLQEDVAFYQGKQGDAWLKGFPAQLTISDALMDRGQQRFGVYCAPCHGVSGLSDGTVAQRAEKLAEGTWVAPTKVTEPHVIVQPEGQLFNTITHGIRNMPAYGAQIPPQDRWAIILYLRALQKSHETGVSDVPARALPQLN